MDDGIYEPGSGVKVQAKSQYRRAHDAPQSPSWPAGTSGRTRSWGVWREIVYGERMLGPRIS